MLAFLQSELIPSIPLAEWTDSAVDWITDNFDGAFDVLDSAIDLVVGSLEYVLLAPPALLMVAILGVIAFLLAGWRVALFTVLGLVFIISLDLWEAAMQTLALVLAATVVALVIGIPIGIIAAKSGAIETAVRPILDIAQTMPAFVYLVPIVVLLGIGAGPGPDRDGHLRHASRRKADDAWHPAGAQGHRGSCARFRGDPLADALQGGASAVAQDDHGRGQPGHHALALDGGHRRAGRGGGLGEPVVTGLSQLNIGLSFVGGVGIVVIAIMLDRITRALARQDGGGAPKIFSRRKGSGTDATRGEGVMGLRPTLRRYAGVRGGEGPERERSDPELAYRRK